MYPSHRNLEYYNGHWQEKKFSLGLQYYYDVMILDGYFYILKVEKDRRPILILLTLPFSLVSWIFGVGLYLFLDWLMNRGKNPNKAQW